MRIARHLSGFSLFCLAAFAQSDRGTITGTVSDPAGAVIANAPIQGRNLQTGVIYESATSTTGNYTLPQLPVGSYEVNVAVQGFKKFTRAGLAVDVAQTIRVDITLEVGATTESITVTEAAPLLKTESGELSHIVTVREMDELPILGIGGSASGTQGIRNPNAILLMIPGTFWTPNGDIRVNGVPADTQSYRIEGQEAMNTGTPGTVGQNQPSVDAIQEVATQTSNFAAEYGQVGGGVFNLTMRSGTNGFHGSGYDYYVNEFLNAGNPYTDNGQGGNTRQKQRRNDYGFTIGGPVWIPKIYNGHDRTFFFINFEEFRESQVVNNQQITVPTTGYRTGDFSAAILSNARVIGKDPVTGGTMLEGMIYNPATTRTVNGQSVRDQFPNNKIDPKQFDPVAAKIQSLFPLPNFNGNALVLNYINPYASHRTTPIPSIKIDESIGTKAKLSYFWQRTKTTNADGNATLGRADGLPALVSPSTGTFTTAPLYRLNFDYSLTPTVLLHFGAGYRATYFQTPAVTPDGKIVYSEVKYNAAQELGLKGGLVNRFFPVMNGFESTLLGGIGNVVNGVNNGIGGSAFKGRNTQSPTFNTSLTWVKSNHTYKFGSEFRTEGYPSGSVGSDGSYTFSADQTGQPFQSTAVGGANVGMGYASFLLGQVKQISIGGPTSPRTGKSQLGIYAQDSWKITRKFTLDYGLRYDYSTYLQEQYGRGATFSPTAILPGAGIPGAAIYDGHGPFQCNCRIAHNYPWAFGPRLGAAYQIDPKTVLRFGFGIVYNGTEQDNGATGTLASSTGGATAATFGSAITTLAQGYPSQYYPPVWPTYDPKFYPTGFPTPGAGPVATDRNAGRPARQYQWSVGLQRQLTKDLLLEAAYVANRGIWWESPEQIDYNAVSYDRLKAFGIDPINNAADRTLLTSFVNSAGAIARGFGKAPYPGFPTSQTVFQALRPFPQFTTISPAWVPLGKSWYDSLQIKATKRFSQGLSFQSTITWSKNLNISGNREPNFGTAANGQVNDVFNRQNNKTLSTYDQPLSFLTSISYVTPKIRGNQIVSWVARDWTVGAFLGYKSGQPILVPAAQTTPALSALVGQTTYANRVAGQPLFLSDLNCHCFDPRNTFVLNPKAWSDPAPGTFGASAAYYNDYRQQRRPSENFNIGRTFRFTERVNLNVRAEFTDVLNRAYISNPVSTNGTTSQRTTNPNGTTSAGFGALLTSTTLQPRNGLIVARVQF